MNSRFITIAFVSSIIVTFLPESHQLECYVCQSQDNNQNKCVETVKICDLEQEQCLTEVRWGSIPHWALSEQKQFFISKRCATKTECQEAIADKNKKCERIWYNDWNCTSCCSGDKCNFFVTLAGHTTGPLNWFFLTMACLVVTMFIHSQNNVR